MFNLGSPWLVNLTHKISHHTQVLGGWSKWQWHVLWCSHTWQDGHITSIIMYSSLTCPSKLNWGFTSSRKLSWLVLARCVLSPVKHPPPLLVHAPDAICNSHIAWGWLPTVSRTGCTFLGKLTNVSKCPCFLICKRRIKWEQNDMKHRQLSNQPIDNAYLLAVITASIII